MWYPLIYHDINILHSASLLFIDSFTVGGGGGGIIGRPYKMRQKWYIRRKWLIDFNGISTCLKLFYAKRFGNCVHYTFRFTIFALLFLWHMVLSYKNNFWTDFIGHQMILLALVRMDLWEMAMKGHSIFPRSPELEVLFGLLWFCGISTIVGYLMPNPLYIKYMSSKHIL